MLALLDAPTCADTALPHQCTARPALDRPWCPTCSALLDAWILTQDALEAMAEEEYATYVM
jgi:hypothetical protein